jgi:CheY-like chemotaxis protein
MPGEAILVVDDDLAALEQCCAKLSSHGYQVLRATSGREALQICEREQGRIDLALVDVVMPEMTGIELLQRLEAAEHTPRMALISGSSPEEVDRLIGSEGSSYRVVWKQYDIPIFLQMIRNVLDAPLRMVANSVFQR